MCSLGVCRYLLLPSPSHPTPSQSGAGVQEVVLAGTVWVSEDREIEIRPEKEREVSPMQGQPLPREYGISHLFLANHTHTPSLP